VSEARAAGEWKGKEWRTKTCLTSLFFAFLSSYSWSSFYALFSYSLLYARNHWRRFSSAFVNLTWIRVYAKNRSVGLRWGRKNLLINHRWGL
jgi:hypothetical protein